MGTDTDRHFIERMRWDDVALRDDRALIVQLRRLQDTLFEVA